MMSDNAIASLTREQEPREGTLPDVQASRFDFLSFCRKCTDPCCNGQIFVTPEEHARILAAGHADHFNDDDGYFSLTTDRCEYLDADHRCTIHEVRPTICRLYPYYPAVEDDRAVLRLDCDCPTSAHFDQDYMRGLHSMVDTLMAGEGFSLFKRFWFGEEDEEEADARPGELLE